MMTSAQQEKGLTQSAQPSNTVWVQQLIRISEYLSSFHFVQGTEEPRVFSEAQRVLQDSNWKLSVLLPIQLNSSSS